MQVKVTAGSLKEQNFAAAVHHMSILIYSAHTHTHTHAHISTQNLLTKN